MTILYQHRDSQRAGNYACAMVLVRHEAIAVRRTASAAHSLVLIQIDDGVLVYLDAEDARRDDTGAHSFAWICAETAELPIP